MKTSQAAALERELRRLRSPSFLTNTARDTADGEFSHSGDMVKVGINGFGRIGRLTFRYAFDMPEVEVVRTDRSSEIDGEIVVRRSRLQCHTAHRLHPHTLVRGLPRAHDGEDVRRRAEAADPRSLQVHVNELLGGAETAAYLIKYDSVHGTWPRKVDNADDHFTVDGQKISFSDKEDFTQAPRQHTHRHGAHPAAHVARSKAQPCCRVRAQVDWKGMGVQIVIDCTGKFLTVRPGRGAPPPLLSPSSHGCWRRAGVWQVAALSPYLDVCGVQRVVVSAPVKEPSVLNVVVGVNDDKLTSDHVICTAA